MYRGISLALLTVETLRETRGVIRLSPAGSDISGFFTGATTNKSMWLLSGGIVAAILGVVGLLPQSRSKTCQRGSRLFLFHVTG